MYELLGMAIKFARLYEEVRVIGKNRETLRAGRESARAASAIF